jgi:hypothetical protein
VLHFRFTGIGKLMQLLLDNDFIDYSQLGLDHKLYRCELLFNMAICHEQLGNERECERYLREASGCSRTNEHRSLIDGGRRGRDLELFYLRGRLFRVPQSKVQNLTKKNFLKDAKVVISDNVQDSFLGFSGATLLEPVLESNGNTLVRKKSEPLPTTNNFSSMSRSAGGGTLARSNTTPAQRPAPSTMQRSPGAAIQRSKSIPENFGRKETVKPSTIGRSKAQDVIAEEPLKEFNDSRERERAQLDYHDNMQRQPRPSNAGHSRGASEGSGMSRNRPSNGKKRMLVARNSSLPSRKYETDKDVPPVPSSPRNVRRDRQDSPREPPRSAPTSRGRDIPRTESPSDSGYEDMKTKLKIHTDSSTVAMYVHNGVSLMELTRLVADKLNLSESYYGRDPDDGGIKLSFVDEEDTDTMISIIDDDDLELAMGNGRGIVHLYLQGGDVLDLY